MKKILLPASLLALTLLANACRPSPQSVSGTIETDEAHLASRYGGRVQKIFAEEGDALTNGQVIAELDAAELQANRDRAAAQLAELVAGPRPEEIAAAKSQWQAQVADLGYARAEARRDEELFAQKTISVSERDLAVSHADSLEKTAAAARSQYDLLLAGTRSEQLDQARAQLAALDAQLREMKIAAPTNSVLEVLGVKPGDVLAPNQEVATLLLTNRTWARVYVPETWLGKIRIGETLAVRVDSSPGKDFRGAVEQIAGSAEFTPRNVQTVEDRIKQVFAVKIRLDNREDALRAGMSVDVEFPAMQP